MVRLGRKEVTTMANIQCSFARIEKKYLLTRAQYRRILPELQAHTEPDEFGQYTICNIYYDTPDFSLIRASLEKPVYKEKLRLRSYGVPTDDSRAFIELKKKFDGVVYKRRITLGQRDAVRYLSGDASAAPDSQIRRELDFFLRQNPVAPRAFIGYDRTALRGTDDPELRITFDTNLRWRDTDVDLRLGDHGAPIALPCGDVLMEVKIPGTCPLWLSHLLSDAQAFPTSFSKYGACYRDELSAGVHMTNLKEDTFCA